VFLLLVYGASPYFSFWRFTVALRSGDTAALNARVDFPAVRESLKTQLAAYFSPEKAGERRIKNKRLARLDEPDSMADTICQFFARRLRPLRQGQQLVNGIHRVA
jgi:Protein of unknown function (DUF2939)